MSIDPGTDHIAVNGRRLRIQINLNSGSFDLIDPMARWPRLEGLTSSVELPTGDVTSAGSAWAVESNAPVHDSNGSGRRAVLSTEPLGSVRLFLDVCEYDDPSIVLVRLGAENVGTEAVPILSLTPLNYRWSTSGTPLSPQALRWYRHGWQSWSPSLALRATQHDLDIRPPMLASSPPDSRRGALVSEEVTYLLDTASQRGLLLGFVTARQQWTQVMLESASRSLRARCHGDGAALLPGETMWSERLMLGFDDEPEAALASYADVMAREMGARVPDASPAGWCSWYFYFTTVSEQDVLSNLRFLEQHKRDLPVGLVQIDDGYQADIGDWTTTNEKFPRGMGPLARDISEAGFAPGIWLAPFLAGERSRLFQEHPDWMITGEGDGPALAASNWNQRNYGLDCSHPDVQRWLETVFREVTEDWGYRYLKIDFLYGAALAGSRHDPASTRIDSYRRGLAAIRRGAGEHRFILGCGALMGASVGEVDGQRIGPDVAPWWTYRPRGQPARRGLRRVGGEPATDSSIRNTLTRSWMHRRLWINDPDCLVARQTRTKLSLQEVQTLATAIALSGGAFFMTDKLTELAQDRIDLLSGLLPVLSGPVHVGGLMDEGMPSAMTMEVNRTFEDWLLVARFNWHSRRRDLEFSLPPGRWHAFDYWRGRYERAYEGVLPVSNVAAHGVRLFALRKVADRPQVVGSTFHVSMGGEELVDVRWDDRTAELALDLLPVPRASGSIFVHVPNGRNLVSATRDGEAVETRRLDTVAIADLTVNAATTLRYQFD